MRNLIIAIVATLALIAGGFFLYKKSQTPLEQTQTEQAATKTSAQNTSDKETSSDTPNINTAGEAVDIFDYPDNEGQSLIQHALSPRYIGSLDAPVVFSDFSSLSCPHCATFHTTVLPKIKQDFVETGKVRMIFELMPLNEAALMGEQLARCIPKKDYYKTLTLFYANQELWAFSDAPRRALVDLAKLAGITQETANKCLDNKELELALTQKAQDNAVEYGIQSTPTFIFDKGERRLKGVGNYSQYKEMLDFLYKQATKTTP